MITKALLGLVAALAVAVLILGVALQAKSREVAEAARVAEAAQLETKGVKAAQAASERQMTAALTDARSQVAGFAVALARAERAAKARPVTVARGSTGPVAVSAPAAPATPGGAAACVLHAGDAGSIDVATAELRTEKGNRILVQAAEAARIDPDGSKSTLFGGEIRADLTQYLSREVETPKVPGMGAGALVLCIPPRCSYGGLLAAPPVLGGHVEAAAGAFGGQAGAGVQAQVVVRF